MSTPPDETSAPNEGVPPTVALIEHLHGHFEEALRFAELLSDETRIRIFFILLREGSLCVTDLTERLGMTQPAVSHHLGLFRASGVLEADRSGKNNFYHISDQFAKGEFINGLIEVGFQCHKANPPIEGTSVPVARPRSSFSYARTRPTVIVSEQGNEANALDLSALEASEVISPSEQIFANIRTMLPEQSRGLWDGNKPNNLQFIDGKLADYEGNADECQSAIVALLRRNKFLPEEAVVVEPTN